MKTGFTIVELASVIAILVILAALAAPRFIDLSDEADRANVAQHAGSLTTAVQLVRMKYIASRQSGNVDNLAGFGDGDVDTNASGFPTDTANANTIPNNATGATRCRNVFLGILVAPAPICGGSIACTSAHYYQAVTTAAQTCRFNYIKDPTPPRFIVYSASTGQVTVTNP